MLICIWKYYKYVFVNKTKNGYKVLLFILENILLCIII